MSEHSKAPAADQADGKGKPDKDLTFTVSSAGDDADFTFPKTAKVSEVIEAARVKFGLSPSDKYTLAFIATPQETFDPNRTLVSYKVEDGSHLLLTSHGSGV
jgi:hypothetical protein